AFAVLKGKDMVVTLANDSVKEMWGKGKEVEGKPLLEVLPEIKDQTFPALLNEVYTTGIPYTSHESLSRLQRNGKMEDVYFDFVYQPYHEADETISGVVIIATEVTPQAILNQKIKESETHFRQLADLMPAKISNVNPEGDVIYFNKQWLDFSGYDFEELKDFGYHKMLHPDEFDEFQTRFQKASETRSVLEMEMRFLNKKGNYKWHLNLAAPVTDENGNIKMWVGVTTEIQQQKEQEEKLETAVKNRTHELVNANEELVQKNQEIALSKYNKRFLSEFSDKFSAYKGHNEFFSSLVQFIADTTSMNYVFVGKLMPDENDQLTIQTIALNAFGKPADNINYSLPDGPCEQVIKGTPYSYPTRCRQTFPKNKMIEEFKVEGYMAYPLNDEQGNAVGLIAVMHEKEIKDAETVSSVLKIVAKRAEIELDRIKNEEQLVIHNTALAEKNEELKKMNLELQAFTYVSSHDLQEPLRKIQNFISHLLETEKQTLSEKGNDYFQRIQESAKRMRTLIQDLLAFSHINKTDRIFENTKLDNIIEQVKVDLTENIKEKNATIEVGETVEVKIIPFLFHQLFYNLISNSIKFSIPGKPVHIIIKSKVEKGLHLNHDKLSSQKRYCHISYTDNGIGFDPQYKDRIFELFQRLHNKEEYPGTGVGLAIVKKIIDNHNGIITAKSEINKGATFDIYIPV
ncbi:MAG: PAS domain-containing sensor histidine kinase, partial [Chitinophagaceae bacterium]